eukprot:TRINITY_DN2063_c2_g1_i1.p1 TRINITY_DN2063_c2_g1~~TRINITY_DN2063_c2_g1_i1.p1  ORF type:complete len:699 (+),score=169.20 TRINITY_DN2063_c2_g1_i1:55-2097(+)
MLRALTMQRRWCSTLKVMNSYNMHGGKVTKYKHKSKSTATDMSFSVFVPSSVVDGGSAGVVYYLSGLTCTDDNFTTKAGAQAHAEEHNVILVAPDTSPRGAGVPNEDASWDFGTGAGFYVDATKKPFNTNYNMYSYVTCELPDLIEKKIPGVMPGLRSIMGHSMGGHGALVAAFKNPDMYASVSAFSPICNPTTTPWGRKAFNGYLKGGVKEGKTYDATELMLKNGPFPSLPEVLVDVGTNDEFLAKELKINALEAACKKKKQKLTVNRRKGYDHSYYFISSFMENHVAFHAQNMKEKATQPKPLKCKAAVAYAPNKPLEIVEVTVDPPKSGEVRVKVMANALCHTDIYTLNGQDPEGLFPCILGHEAGAIVESVGPNVTSVKPGDHVIPCYTPECGKPDCIFCASPKTNLCPAIRATQGKGVMPDGTSRFKDSKGNTLYHFMGCSTFSEYTVLAEISCAKIDKRMDFEKASLFGCGIATGLGAVWNTTKAEPGSTVGVWGLGAVGLSVIQAAKKAGAKKIFAIDVNPKKFKIAKEFGATDFLNPKKLKRPVNEEIVSLTKWGLDYTYDCTGSTAVMRTALESSHRGWGTSCVIGVAAAGQELATRPFQLVTGRRWVGTAFGGWKSRTDVPKLVQSSLNGDLPVGRYITHRFKGVEKINAAIKKLKGGDCLRAVVTYHDK